MAENPLTPPIEKDTFSPIPNRELLDFILYRLAPSSEQRTTALRTLNLRERLLYKRFAEAGAEFPPLTPRKVILEDRHLDALFEEIFARGGFDLRGFHMNHKGPVEFKRELWGFLRGEGFVYCVDDGAGGGWWSLGASAAVIYCGVLSAAEVGLIAGEQGGNCGEKLGR